jgi:hypothetical protein
MQTVAHVVSSVHEFVERARFRPAVAAVVCTVLGGIQASGSVVLSEVLRAQVDNAMELHATEQRVSLTLKHETALDTLPEVYLATIAEAARSLRFRSVDGSDLSKPASRKLEYLDVVRDGSAKPRDRVAVGPGGVQTPPPFPDSTSPDAVIQTPASRSSKSRDRNARKRQRRSKDASLAPPPARPAPRLRTAARSAAREERKAQRIKFPSRPALKKLGYWLVQVEAGDGTGTHLPLVQELYSTQDPAYQALGEKAWSMTFEREIVRVIQHIGRDGVWQMDRGFDDVFWLNRMSTLVEQHVIRLKVSRRVHLGTKDQKSVAVGQLAETLQARYTTQIRYVDKSTHQERHTAIQYTWAPIWIDGVEHPLYLLVAHTGPNRRMFLVTNRRPEHPEEAAALIRAYFERWGNEEMTRASKQLTGLERIRVRSFAAMRRLVWLAMISVGIQALSVLTRPRLRRATLDRAKEFIASVRFVLYRVWRVVQSDVRRALDVRPHLFT